jgi:hypothetical protein
MHQELPVYLAPGEEWSYSSIVEHIQHHSEEHNIVICTLLCDVRALSQELLQTSLVWRESDTREIDLKAASMFFKSVDLTVMLSAKIHDK